jgi:excisionase family DNA binding protein
MSDEMMTYAEVASMTGLPLGTLYSLVSQRRIAHVRLGKRLVRFRRTEIVAWLAAHNVPVQAPKASP